jgi:ketosteroid isomerase-like protein
MKLTWISVAAVLVSAAPVVATPDRSFEVSVSDMDAIGRLNAARHDAYRTRDRAALERILADDFIAIRANGATQSKVALIDAATSSRRDIRRVTWDNVQIHVRGDTAFVTGRSYLEGTSEGRDISNTTQYADVYVRRDGEWKIAATRILRATPTLVETPRAMLASR